MMKSNGAKAATTLAINAFILGMYYLWQFEGIEQAGNVFMFWVWFIGVVGTILVFIPATANDYMPRTAIQKVFRFIVSPLILLGTIWAGHIFAATVYAIAALVAEARRKEAKRLSEARA